MRTIINSLRARAFRLSPISRLIVRRNPWRGNRSSDNCELGLAIVSQPLDNWLEVKRLLQAMRYVTLYIIVEPADALRRLLLHVLLSSWEIFPVAFACFRDHCGGCGVFHKYRRCFLQNFLLHLSHASLLSPWHSYPLKPYYCLQDCHYFYRSALRLLSIPTFISSLYK